MGRGGAEAPRAHVPRRCGGRRGLALAFVCPARLGAVRSPLQSRWVAEKRVQSHCPQSLVKTATNRGLTHFPYLQRAQILLSLRDYRALLEFLKVI